jgi:hypothetical protein
MEDGINRRQLYISSELCLVVIETVVNHGAMVYPFALRADRM